MVSILQNLKRTNTYKGLAALKGRADPTHRLSLAIC